MPRSAPIASPTPRSFPASISRALESVVMLHEHGKTSVHLPPLAGQQKLAQEVCRVLEDCGGIWDAPTKTYVFWWHLLAPVGHAFDTKAMLKKVTTSNRTIPPLSDSSLFLAP